MPVEIYRYTLKSHLRLNAAGERTEHDGILIRVDSSGVGCIHPWPELGDDPLPRQLELLKRGQSSPLIERALACAEIDGAARNERCNLIAENPPPLSHWTASMNPEADNPADLLAEGFQVVKLKGNGREIPGLLAEVDRWLEAGYKIRIDLNETGDLPGVLKFWESLVDPTGIEFIEDPIPWDEESWMTLRDAGIPLAADRGLEIREKAELADFQVVKPALQGPEMFQHLAGKEMIVTSYMDHPVGQMFAAYTAGAMKVTATCGLLTHHLFEPDDFIKQITTKGPILNPPPGYGLGFDHLLEKLPWESL